ncbi:phage holin, LLH family [Paenibacillus sp. HB172176]|uniref:phage holin, LLH family n=1 Tax=Paenibacillus sp. HB172176 TaxID=2493690 RepID=UPI0014398E94|nr:phage holin, LLH family [Paenibacillus sp. HB172176]
MMENLQPFIDAIVTALVGLLVTAILGLLAVLKSKIETWLTTKTSVQQREILTKLAGEGMAFAESIYEQAGGPQKLEAAYAYVLQHVEEIGIKINSNSIKAAIEKAVLDYNSHVKGSGKQ